MRLEVVKVNARYLLARSTARPGVVLVHEEHSPELNISACKPGDYVDADVSDGPRGLRGENAVWLEPQSETLDLIDAVVKVVLHDKVLGFAAPQEGGTDLFFHHSGFTDYNRTARSSAMFNGLSVGDQLRGFRRLTTKGPRLERCYVVAQEFGAA